MSPLVLLPLVLSVRTCAGTSDFEAVTPHLVRHIMDAAMKNFDLTENSVLVLVERVCVEGRFRAELLRSSLLTFSERKLSRDQYTAVIVSSVKNRIRFICPGSIINPAVDQPCRELFTLCLHLTAWCSRAASVFVTRGFRIKSEEYSESDEIDVSRLDPRSPVVDGVRLMSPMCRCLKFANVSPRSGSNSCARSLLTDQSTPGNCHTNSAPGAQSPSGKTQWDKASQALKTRAEEAAGFRLATWVTYGTNPKCPDPPRNTSFAVFVEMKFSGWTRDSGTSIETTVLTCYMPLRSRNPSCLSFFRVFSLSTWVAVLLTLGLAGSITAAVNWRDRTVRLNSLMDSPSTRPQAKLHWLAFNTARSSPLRIVVATIHLAIGFVLVNLNKGAIIADFTRAYDELEIRKIIQNEAPAFPPYPEGTLKPFWLQTPENFREDLFVSFGKKGPYCTTAEDLFLHAFPLPTAVHSRTKVYRDAMIGDREMITWSSDAAISLIQKFALLPTQARRAFPIQPEEAHSKGSRKTGLSVAWKTGYLSYLSYGKLRRMIPQKFGATADYQSNVAIGLPVQATAVSIIMVLIGSSLCIGSIELRRRMRRRANLERKSSP